MPKIKQDLLTLNQTDVWSMVLFVLYKIKDIPEYSTLSELIYLLDKDSVLKLCEYFGGQTITLPTIDDLESLVKSLVLYQYTVIDNMDYDKAIELIGGGKSRALKTKYLQMCEVLNTYTFTSRS